MQENDCRQRDDVSTPASEYESPPSQAQGTAPKPVVRQTSQHMSRPASRQLSRPVSRQLSRQVSRQVSSDDYQSDYDISVLRGSKRLFTLVNYGQAPVDQCPTTPPLLEDLALIDITGNVPEYRATSCGETSFITGADVNSNTRETAHDEHVTSDDDVAVDIDGLLASKTDIVDLNPRCDVSASHVNQPAKGNNKATSALVAKIKQAKRFEDDAQQASTQGSFTKSLPIRDLLRRANLFARRKQKRLVFKNGELNFRYTHIRKKNVSYVMDTFTTLLDLKWRYLFVLFSITFLCSWLLFGLIWWSFVLFANDGDVSDSYGTTCLVGVDNFASALLFSLETEQTIGYGTRSVTEECPLAIGLAMLQSLLGVLLTCVWTGVLFGKFSRPRHRAETIIFSKRAVICERNGQRCLVFRVGDMRKSHMVGVTIRAVLIQPSVTLEGEEQPFYQHNLHVTTEAEDFFFLAWPIKVIHVIDKDSPLWKTSQESLLASEFEIVVVLEGTNQSTGQATHVRTSYLPGEILWGHRLNSLITSLKDDVIYRVNYTSFHDTVPIIMSERSAESISK